MPELTHFLFLFSSMFVFVIVWVYISSPSDVFDALCPADLLRDVILLPFHVFIYLFFILWCFFLPWFVLVCFFLFFFVHYVFCSVFMHVHNLYIHASLLNISSRYSMFILCSTLWHHFPCCTMLLSCVPCFSMFRWLPSCSLLLFVPCCYPYDLCREESLCCLWSVSRESRMKKSTTNCSRLLFLETKPHLFHTANRGQAFFHINFSVWSPQAPVIQKCLLVAPATERFSRKMLKIKSWTLNVKLDADFYNRDSILKRSAQAEQSPHGCKMNAC